MVKHRERVCAMKRRDHVERGKQLSLNVATRSGICLCKMEEKALDFVFQAANIFAHHMDKQVSISTWSVPFETQIGLYTVNIEQDEQNQTMVDIYMNRDD
ncbi:hypothetical protein PRIPAC_72360 [Pristionchus pacificus]|uniref:Uncharacterized protein n=1 Tax=Pristionchus pacificus TaxID=54126 RepID=A0A2A6B4B4_PRIPA|nr:hypothetical protein PRIPAC_72360 [Pristionchus pacificus]|eukprot:PDM60708.1 hypothetical protein PRIPAC_54514 [Pristionchus pacificus]